MAKEHAGWAMLRSTLIRCFRFKVPAESQVPPKMLIGGVYRGEGVCWRCCPDITGGSNFRPAVVEYFP